MTNNNKIEYHSLIKQLNRRATRAVVSQLNFRSDLINRHLDGIFSRECGEPGSFLGDPVFEATFGWEAASPVMKDLEGKLLSKQLIDALDSPPRALAGEYTFSRKWHPYRHQLESWQTLLQDDWKSVLVSSGTGSGKTECFLIPILQDLTKQLEQQSGPLVGVNALMLYPLNALINSQRTRLQAWTHQYKGDIRFCLYNGETPRSVKAEDQHRNPQEVLSRDGLWASPPPILVTNSTMLEYMMVRNADRPILEQSQGKLRWIILDEAHTYIGTQAAELALLLRRVMHGFGVRPGDVRFVATSATIGGDDEESNRKLQEYLAQVAGVSPEQVKVVRGDREIPVLEDVMEDDSDLSACQDELHAEEPAALYEMFVRNRGAREIRDLLSNEPTQMSVITSRLKKSNPDISPDKGLAFLDQLTRASDATGQAFLPLRGHIFEKTLGGIWACCNGECGGRAKLGLDELGWKFGAIYLHHQAYCEYCNAAVYELASCTDCGTEYLLAEEEQSNGKYKLSPISPGSGVDEFLLDIELDEEEDAVDSAEQNRRLLSPAPATRIDYLEPGSIELCETPSETSIALNLVLPDVSSGGASGLRCVYCSARERFPNQKFRFKKLGAPFFLGDVLPTLLEQCPPGKGAEKQGPSNGRRLLTFTDSRQGTARIASRLQQDADRNFVRSNVYHSLAAQAVRDQSTDVEAIDTEIAKLQGGLDQLQDFLRGVIEDKIKALMEEKEAAGQQIQPRLSWEETAGILVKSPVIKQWMLDEFRRITGSHIAPQEFADFCLYREFARRPKRVNQSETLGLMRLHYERIDQLTTAPDKWQELGASLQDWKDYLCLIVDHHIRENSAIHIPDTPVHFTKWMGARIYPKLLQGPGSENRGSRYLAWPEARSKGRSSRFVNLLAESFRRDLGDAYNREMINHILDQAWYCIRPMLEEYSDGYQLDFKRQVMFDSPEEGWRCPYTLRILPRTFRGLSPYLPGNGAPAKVCIAVSMPRLPFKHWRDDRGADIPQEKREAWLEHDEKVIALRDQWLWPNRSDRIAVGEQWYAIGEHSAQQPKYRLERLESDFKKGRINILSCSTTMEMGVDIGGMSAVAMNNAPPSQANYQQRAGRAGRRQEAASVSVTLCRDSAHGQQVFNDPLWAFDKNAMSVPVVNLTSEIVVQRHVNAFLLAEWLRQFDDDAPKLETGWLFLGVEGHDPRVNRFVLWCEELRHKPPTRIVTGVQDLVKHSFLEAVSLSEIGLRTARAMEGVATAWEREHAVLDEQLQDLLEGKGDVDSLPAVKALRIQIRRLTGEYLLKDLTVRGFLPGHGFPVGVVSMITTTIQDLIKKKEHGKEREDNVARSSRGATRERKVAIREYAPGAEFVVDGRVFQSSGITLNWHIPADTEAAGEIQDIRWSWFCSECGSGGTSISRPEICGQCGDSNLRRNEVLEPSGFTVDLRYEPHNNTNNPRYLPFNDPRVQIGSADWQSMPDSRLGRFRLSDHGTVLYWNGGGHANVGYSVCLRCGRAAEQSKQGTLPAELAREHKRLRGGKDADGSTVCDGSHNDWAIKRDLWLIAESTTSVIELQLFDPVTEEPLTDDTIAWSIGYALRHGLVKSLGIDVREVSVAVQSFKDAVLGKVLSIFLYDSADMGAGYVEQLPELLSKAVEKAKTLLDCPQACDSACHSCLLGWDSQHRVDMLDRHTTAKWLDQWAQHLELPESSRYFGERSFPELRPIEEALRAARNKKTDATFWLFLDGDPDDWDLLGWQLLADIQYWASERTPIRLVLPEQALNALDDGQRRLLSALVQLYSGIVTVNALEVENSLGNNAKLIAYTESDTCKLWAASGVDLIPGANWGHSDDVIVIGKVDNFNMPTRNVTVDELSPAAPPPEAPGVTLSEIQIKRDCDSKLSIFGDQFWKVMSQGHAPLERELEQSKIRSVYYRDRYLVSPLHAALLSRVLSGLAGKLDSSAVINIDTMELYGDKRSPHAISHNWTIVTMRNDVLRGLLEDTLERKVVLRVKQRREIEHRRELRIEWDSGATTTLWLDEGVGCWRVSGYRVFGFTSGVMQQIRELKKLDCYVSIAQPMLGTWALVKSDETD